MNESEILIVGAGIAGLLCATELEKAGRHVRLVDKGRGVGGRMATRRMGGGRLDHGAQFFTVRDERFEIYLRAWQEAGVVREWYRTPPDDKSPKGEIRYCGMFGMSDVPKHLASKLTVHGSERMQKLSRCHDQWIATSENGQTFCAQELVLTAPLPQTLQLLDTTGLDYAGEDHAALRAITYAKGLALLAILDGPSGLPEPGAIKLANSTVDWIADNHMKGISPDGIIGITVHATAAFAEKHWTQKMRYAGPC
jgi:renalase